jgi:2-polyprenyl-6-methoxyphenol hydroxylase-like FAD-dependent oxidoreductase
MRRLRPSRPIQDAPVSHRRWPRRSMSREDVRDTDDYVEANIGMVGKGHGHNEPAGTVTSKFVACCDGANSIVRKSSGITFHPYQGADSHWLVVDVIPKTPGARYQWADSKSARQYLDYRRLRTSGAFARDKKTMGVHGATHGDLRGSYGRQLHMPLLKEFSCTHETAEIERRTVYTLRGGWVKTFSKGVSACWRRRASRAQFPGQGLNSGLRGARRSAGAWTSPSGTQTRIGPGSCKTIRISS